MYIKSYYSDILFLSVDPCASRPCGRNGRCSVDGEGHSCSCNSGYVYNGQTCIRGKSQFSNHNTFINFPEKEIHESCMKK